MTTTATRPGSAATALARSSAPVSVSSVIARLHADLDRLDPAGGVGLDTTSLVRDVERAISRLSAVKLSLVAAADRALLAQRSGLTGTAAWVASTTRATGPAAAAQVTLATALDTSLSATGAALAEGRLSTEHAAVIAATDARLPQSLTTEERVKVEQRLVASASKVDPARLRTLARRALAFAERSAAEADAHHESELASEEARAYAAASLTLHDNRDGTTTGHFTVPTHAGAILRKTLQQMTAPRRRSTGGERVVDWRQRNGQAFTDLLEHLPTDHLTGKTAATLLVTIDHDRLTESVREAGLALSPAGATPARTDTGHELSATAVRRLACNAGLVPVVLGGAGQLLDLGREARFYSQTQRAGLGVLYDTCAAHDCDRPFAWCELHHLTPWAQGGRTDLAEAAPLCGWHHRRIHDPAYRHEVTTRPEGAKTVRFRPRT